MGNTPARCRSSAPASVNRVLEQSSCVRASASVLEQSPCISASYFTFERPASRTSHQLVEQAVVSLRETLYSLLSHGARTRCLCQPVPTKSLANWESSQRGGGCRIKPFDSETCRNCNGDIAIAQVQKQYRIRSIDCETCRNCNGELAQVQKRCILAFKPFIWFGVLRCIA